MLQIPKSNLKILDLSLTYHWYDMIECGEKKEEYREIKDFYWKRLIDLDKTGGCYKGCDRYRKSFDVCLDCKVMNWKHYDVVRFHRGQGGKQSMLVEIKDIRIGRGKVEWGAPLRDVFVIELGKIIK